MIKLLADSTCDLSDEVLKQYDISLAPLTITINGKDYKDRIDIQGDDFYELLGSLEVLPTTAMPSPTEYLELINQAILDGYTEILCINMSSGTSGSYQSAMLSRDMFYEDHPQSKIRIHMVDSTCMSHGSGYLLLKTAQLREQGATFDELVRFNETFKANVKHLLSVDDLSNLIKSGRLTNVSAMIGRVLSIKPIMSMRKGRGAIVGRVRGRKKVFTYYLDEFKKRNDPKLTDFILIGYTSDITKAKIMESKLRKDVGFEGKIYIMQMGVSVGTHVGLGGLSMYFFETGEHHAGLIVEELETLLAHKKEMFEMVQKYRDKVAKKD